LFLWIEVVNVFNDAIEHCLGAAERLWLADFDACLKGGCGQNWPPHIL
jgi:hypothetical protein